MKTLSWVYTVVTYAVFGGIQNVESFTSIEKAYKCFFTWANENNSENIVFDDVSKALEWFRNNEADLSYTIDFFEYRLGD